MSKKALPLLLALAFPVSFALAEDPQGSIPYDKFEPPDACSSCHVDIARQHERSMMAQSFTHAWDAFNKLPPNHRNTPAMANLEVRIKAALESLAQQPQAGPTK